MDKEIRIKYSDHNFFRMAEIVGDRRHLWPKWLGIPAAERYDSWEDYETMERVIRCVGVEVTASR